MEDREGIFISTKEMYEMMLKLNDNIIILNSNVEELKKIRPDCLKRQDTCNKTFQKLSTRLSSVAAQMKIIWVLVSGTLLAIIKLFLEGVQR